MHTIRFYCRDIDTTSSILVLFLSYYISQCWLLFWGTLKYSYLFQYFLNHRTVLCTYQQSLVGITSYFSHDQELFSQVFLVKPLINLYINSWAWLYIYTCFLIYLCMEERGYIDGSPYTLMLLSLISASFFLDLEHWKSNPIVKSCIWWTQLFCIKHIM